MAYLLNTVSRSELRDKANRHPSVFALQSSLAGVLCFFERERT